MNCQSCLKELDNRFEEEEGLCHYCSVVSNEELKRLGYVKEEVNTK